MEEEEEKREKSTFTNISMQFSTSIIVYVVPQILTTLYMFSSTIEF